MQFFTEYIEPITDWLHIHPYWTIAITFLTAFAESLAIIGSIIPGSITMTTLGILAGAGVTRLDLTLIAAILGAIAGDWASYLLGYFFSDRISGIWPFRRYPNWLLYGKDFFKRHGGKSVLIGRFVGPLRSIIPIIAGMVHMSHTRFFVANFLSAIGWSVLYVMPGVLIGAAGSELSPESATRLFILVLLFIAAVSVLSFLIKWLASQINRILSAQFQNIWTWSIRHPYLAIFFQAITPENETQHYNTAFLFVSFLITTSFFIFLFAYVELQTEVIRINHLIFLFLQSIRTGFFDSFFIFIINIIKPVVLVTLGLFITGVLAVKKRGAALLYWLGLHLVMLVIVKLSHFFTTSPYPQGLQTVRLINHSFPAVGILFFTAQLAGLFLYLYTKTYQKTMVITATTLLVLIGFGSIYLGDQWLLDVVGGYSAGLSSALILGLFYRKKNNSYSLPLPVVLLYFSLLSLATLLVTFNNYGASIKAHHPYHKQYLFTYTTWWDQKALLLPIFRKNRIGRETELFNLQYIGELEPLKNALIKAGWEKQDPSLLLAIMNRLSGDTSTPLMAELYLDKKPVLVMNYKPLKNYPPLILKLWRSNYHIHQILQPIWIGSVQFQTQIKSQNNLLYPPALPFLTQALPLFKQKTLLIPLGQATTLYLKVEPKLLLITEE